LIKGGHGSGAESVDLLVDTNGIERLVAPRFATRNTHGTGCTLSSAIAAGLAKGMSLIEAARAGQELRDHGDRRRRPPVDRVGPGFEPRPGPSFLSVLVKTMLQRQFRSEQ
jgi:sugar/nucleoside kinase (ribokinase family)